MCLLFCMERWMRRKSVKKYPFLIFFSKMLMSAFLLRFKANYLGKNAWLPQFFFVDFDSPCKDLRFPHGPNLAQKPMCLVSTVLNWIRKIAFGLVFESREQKISWLPCNTDRVLYKHTATVTRCILLIFKEFTVCCDVIEHIASMSCLNYVFHYK